MPNKKIIVTGSAGFIGSALTIKLLDSGYTVLGIDDHNDYYDPNLKAARVSRHKNHPNYEHSRIDISEKEPLFEVALDFEPNIIINLAAQPGVRYSLENPDAYIKSNLLGFFNILELSKKLELDHLIYASSSSVYGATTKIPFKPTSPIDHPMNLYAATKKSNESLSHAYSHLYNIPTTGLRFFTVYGPWGRPDMAPMLFINKIIKGEKIMVNNFGKHKRDFTYIDDIINGIESVIKKKPEPNPSWDSERPQLNSSSAPWKIYNIGRGHPIELLDFIGTVEKELGIKAKKELVPLQIGDMIETYADMSEYNQIFGSLKETNIEEGIKELVKWYREFYSL